MNVYKTYGFLKWLETRRDFRRFVKSILSKVNAFVPPLFNSSEVLTFVFDKARLLNDNFVQNSHLDYSCISLPTFNSGTYLRLHSISQNPRLVKKIITNLDSSKDSDLDSIPVLVVKKCESDFS